MLVTTVGSMALAIATQETVVQGISVEGIPLGGMTRQEAYDKVSQMAEQKLADNMIRLSYKEGSWEIPAESIELKIDVDAIMEEVYGPGHTGDMVQRFKENINCMMNGKNIDMTADYSGPLLDSQLQQIAGQIRQEPSSAVCYFGPGMSIVKKPAVLGIELNTDNVAAALNTDLIALRVPSEIILEPSVVQPSVTDADVAHMDTVLASYSSSYFHGGGRGQNIQIAALALNSVLVRPNAEFSFNNTVGYRSADNGYKSAPVLIAGKFEMDYGGGVCQVSSTLYNAILLAGLTPTERTRHFFPSSYVPAGQDATVADGVLDFKFRNPYPHGVYLLTSCYDGNLNIYVVGCGADLQGRQYRLDNEVIKGGAAPVVTLSRITYQNGVQVAMEELHTDHYDLPSV